MSSEDNDESTEQVLEYYKKYSQNRNLPKYFSGTSVSYLPSIVAGKDDNEPSDRETVNTTEQPVHVSEINIIVDDADSVNSSESPSEHKKLEWDNGADIGYDSARKNSETKIQKSSSLPTLNKLKEMKPTCTIPASKPSTIITHSTSSKDVEVLVYGGDSNSSNETSSNSFKQVTQSSENASSDTVTTSKSKVSSSLDSSETKLVDFQSTIDFLKYKIGLPGAHSTPNVENPLMSNTKSSKSSLAALLSKNLSSRSKSDEMISIGASGSFVSEVNTKSSSHSSKPPTKKSKKKIETKIVELSVTTPINVNCKGLGVASSDKTVQTFHPKAVQTDIADCYYINHEQQQKSKSKLDSANISEDVADLASSFEYISVDKNAKVLKLTKRHQDIISINSSTIGVSGVIKEISVLKNSTESSSLSKTSSDDIDRHLEILHNLLKTKKLNSRTKRRYLKMLLKDINELETSTTSTTSSSELFIPKKGAVAKEKVRKNENVMDKGKIRFSFSSIPGKIRSSDEQDACQHNQPSTPSSSPDMGGDTLKDHVKVADINEKVEGSDQDVHYQYKNVQFSKSSSDYKDVENNDSDKDVEQLSVNVSSNAGGCEVSKKTNELLSTKSGSAHVHVTCGEMSEVGNVGSSKHNGDLQSKMSHSKHLSITKSGSVKLHTEYGSGGARKDENSKTSNQIAQLVQFPSVTRGFAEAYTECNTIVPKIDKSVASLAESSKTFYEQIGKRVKIVHSKQLPNASSSTGIHHIKYDSEATISGILKGDSHTNKCVLQDQNIQTCDRFTEVNSRSVQSIAPLQNAIKGENTQTSKPLLQDHSGQISNEHVSKATSTTEIPKSSTKSSSKYDALRNDATISSSNSGSKDSDDYALKFAENERAYQLNWINNEISHLSKLKGILELKSGSRSRTSRASARPKTSVYHVIQKNGSNKTSERNYVIQTKLGVPTDQNINYILDGKEYVVSSSQKNTSDEDKTTLDIQIKSNEEQTNIKVNSLCSICKKVVCICGSEKTITSKFPSLSTEPKEVDPFFGYPQGVSGEGEDFNTYLAYKNIFNVDERLNDKGEEEITSHHFSDSEILSSEDYSSLQKVFKKCTCTVNNLHCGCDFVKNLLNKFRVQKVGNTIEMVQTDSSTSVQQIKPSAEIQTDTVPKLSSAVQGKVSTIDGAYQSRNLYQQTMIQINIPPVDNRESQQIVASKHISLQTLKDVLSQYTQTEINNVNRDKISDSQSKLSTQRSIPSFSNTESDVFYSFRGKREITDLSKKEKNESDEEEVFQKEQSLLHEKGFKAKNIGIQATPSLTTQSSQNIQDNDGGFKNSREKSASDQKEIQTERYMLSEKRVETKHIGIQAVPSWRTRSSQKIQDKDGRFDVTGKSRGKSDSDQKITQTEGDELRAKHVETKNIGIQAASSLDNVKTRSRKVQQDNVIENSGEKSENDQKVTQTENEKRVETKNIAIQAVPSFKNMRTRSTQKVQDEGFKATENSGEKSEGDQKITQTENQKLVVTRNVAIQAMREGSSEKIQSKKDGLKESALQNESGLEDKSRTDRTVASNSHSSNMGTSAHTTPSDSKSSSSSRVTCFCCKQKAFLAKISYLDEGNDSLAVCSRCFFQRPRYCSHNPRFMCRCWSYWRSAQQNLDTGQYCKCCRKEASKCAKKLSGLIYTVTLPKHGSVNKKRRSSRGSVESIKVQKGWSWKSVKNKENYYKKDDDRKNGLKKEIDEDKDDVMEKDLHKKKKQDENRHNNNAQYTLMEYLIRNRPEFIYSAEYRRQMLLNSRILRERQKDNLKLNFLENSLGNTNGDKYKLFTEREMKEINKKNYKKLPEVQGKLINQRESRLRLADRLISSALAKKVQKSVLQGKGNFPIDKPLTNL